MTRGCTVTSETAWHPCSHTLWCSTISSLSHLQFCRPREYSLCCPGTPGHTCTRTSHWGCCLILHQTTQRTWYQAGPPLELVFSSSHSCNLRSRLAELPGTLCLFHQLVFSFYHTHSHHC